LRCIAHYALEADRSEVAREQTQHWQTNSPEILSCAELEAKLEAASVAVDLPTEVTLGTWDGVPASLTTAPDVADYLLSYE